MPRSEVSSSPSVTTAGTSRSVTPSSSTSPKVTRAVLTRPFAVAAVPR